MCSLIHNQKEGYKVKEENSQNKFSEKEIVEKYLSYWKEYILNTFDIRRLNEIIFHIPSLRKLVWKEILKRKNINRREYHYWVHHILFYMRIPEISESAWRVFMNEAKKNSIIYSYMISIYIETPKFRRRIANRKMKKPEDVYLHLLCLVASDFPGFLRKVTKELRKRFFKCGKLTGTGKFELITIVRYDPYSKELKRWATDILLEESLSDRELGFIYDIFPKK